MSQLEVAVAVVLTGDNGQVTRRYNTSIIGTDAVASAKAELDRIGAALAANGVAPTPA